MAKYVMWGSYCADVLEKRAPYRPDHLAGLEQQKNAGILITLGPTKDLTKVLGIYEADSVEQVQQVIEADPYWLHGIWTDYEIKEWIQAIS